MASSKIPVEFEFALPIQSTATFAIHEMSVLQPKKNSSLNIAAKATIQTILDKDYANFADEAQHSLLCSTLAFKVSARPLRQQV
ncbi:hypothetical protein GBA52_010391 [Prunus armeniaca]|nr:hypothetical protein GBA52_010391 [Prunus armeniaca]